MHLYIKMCTFGNNYLFLSTYTLWWQDGLYMNFTYELFYHKMTQFLVQYDNVPHAWIRKVLMKCLRNANYLFFKVRAFGWFPLVLVEIYVNLVHPKSYTTWKGPMKHGSLVARDHPHSYYLNTLVSSWTRGLLLKAF